MVIRLLILTVMLKNIKTDIYKTTVERLLPQGCKKINHDVRIFSTSDPKHFGLKNAMRLYSTRNEIVFDYTQDHVVRKIAINNTHQINQLAHLFKLEGMPEAEAGIARIKQNGCYFDTTDYKSIKSTSYKMINVYLIEEKFIHDLFDFLGTKQKYLKELQWQIDLMIKIAIVVRKIHKRNIVLRNLDLTTIRMKDLPQYSSSYPILNDFHEAVTVGQGETYNYEHSFFQPKNEFNKSDSFAFDIYSLGKIFYAISHWNVFSSTGARFLYKCDSSSENQKPNFLYCDYLEEFIFEMINEDPSQRPSIDSIITRLREVRVTINNKLFIIYEYLRNQIETGVGTDENGNLYDLTPIEVKKLEEIIKDYSYLYEVHVIHSLSEINQLYPEINNPYRMQFYEEHQEMLEALEKAGYNSSNLI